jgi:hypothetical protein
MSVCPPSVECLNLLLAPLHSRTGWLPSVKSLELINRLFLRETLKWSSQAKHIHHIDGDKSCPSQVLPQRRIACALAMQSSDPSCKPLL